MSQKTRDRRYITEAFRRWARLGCPGPEGIRGRRDAGDLLACAAVFVMLEERAADDGRRKNRTETMIAEAIRAVYMVQPDRPLRRSDITLRVRRFAVERYAGERTVYAWLASGRALWESVRKTVQ